MAKQKQFVQTFYLTLEPKYGTYNDANKIVGFTVEKLFKQRPTTATGPVIEIKLNLPESVFQPLHAEISLVPDSLIDEAVVAGLQAIAKATE